MIRTICVLLVTAAVPPAAHAEVTRLEITQRTEIEGSGYERIVGIVHFRVDPKDPHNQVIADLDKAPKNADGRVEFSADLYVLRPKDAARSNGVALLDVLNRGNKGILRLFNGASAGSDPKSGGDLGDGYLTRQGFTLVWVGWEFDVRSEAGAMRIAAPLAKGISTIVRGDLTPGSRSPEQTVSDLVGYTPADPKGPASALTVRNGPFGAPETIAADKWQLRGNTITLAGGFEPGRTYQLAYRVADPPIAGVGLLAFRDVGAWVRTSSEAMPAARSVYAFGASQSGRFLREFLYYGCNTDERGARVFDAVWAHIAGAARLGLNERGSTPTGLSMFTNSSFPFANTRTRDPISGRIDGLLDNDRARRNQPKMFFTNTATEYWGGGRSAALLHTTPDGKDDLALPENTRVYFLTGAPHTSSPLPTTGQQQPQNPLDVGPVMRALLVALDGWVQKGVAPPAARIPRLADGTLVPIERTAFPAIPGVASPKMIHPGRQDGKPLPLLVPQVDEDGNERSGIRVPAVAVPLATYTGWNFRGPSIGGTTELVALMGSMIRLLRTAPDRQSAKDPRRSIEERYASREAYLDRIHKASEQLVKDRYLLAEDVPSILRRAEADWLRAH
jgi:hypothetical protein